MNDAPGSTARPDLPVESWRHVPTSAAERWEEIVEASHDGWALIDARGRIGYASTTFASLMGVSADALAGVALSAVVPGLDRASTLDRGAPTRLEVQRERDHTGPRWLRLTLVPRPDRGSAPSGSIALVRDVTRLRFAQERHRWAQRRLTEVDDQIRSRAQRKIHDGPVQILAVLTLRLSTAVESGLDPQLAEALKASIETAATELRELLQELATADGATVGERLTRWAEPALASTALEIEMVDLLDTEPDRSVVEAMFAFVHQTSLAAADDPKPRVMRVTIAPSGDSFLVTIEVPAGTEGFPAETAVASNLAIGRSFARALNGTLDVEWADPALPLDERVHVVRVGLPTTAATSLALDLDDPPTSKHDRRTTGSAGISANDVDDHDLEALAEACHEGLMEIDGDLVVTFVNNAYSAAMRRPADELIGLPFEQLFQPDDYERLLPYIEKVRAGEAIRFDWQRRNAAGDVRWTQVSASPRCDTDGRFAGALLVTLDTSEFHHTLDLIQTVSDQIERARRGTTQAIARKLHDGPLQRLHDVSVRLGEIAATIGPAGPVEAVRNELERSIAQVRESLGDLEEPEIDDGDWVRALTDLVAPLMNSSSTTLRVRSEVNEELEASLAATVVRVAREAIANAVLHGHADRIDVELAADDDGATLRVSDDGVGIDSEALVPRPGHLGIRSMRARVAERKGTLTIDADPSGGTHVVAYFPEHGAG